MQPTNHPSIFPFCNKWIPRMQECNTKTGLISGTTYISMHASINPLTARLQAKNRANLWNQICIWTVSCWGITGSKDGDLMNKRLEQHFFFFFTNHKPPDWVHPCILPCMHPSIHLLPGYEPKIGLTSGTKSASGRSAAGASPAATMGTWRRKGWNIIRFFFFYKP